jgi:DNA-binding SARP family transcriptional activator
VNSNQTSGSLYFQVLGPVRAWCDGDEIDVGSARQRAVLARLLLPTEQPHPIPEIIDAVWGEDLPGDPRNLVHKYVGGLRRALDPGNAASRTSALLPLTANGYALQINRSQVDLEMFTRKVAGAMALCDSQFPRDSELLRDGELPEARNQLNGALGLWQGPAFGQLSGEFFAVERKRLTERQLTVIEDRIGIDIAMGQHTEAAADLVSSLFENPLREHLSALLMIALYRSGRQADSLGIFQDCRRRLINDLGIEPGQELQRVHQQILAGEPVRSLRLSSGADIAPIGLNSSSGGVPAEADNGGTSVLAGVISAPEQRSYLKPDINDFSGREREVRRICAILVEPAAAPPVVVITGMAGIGKTALAMRIANLMKSQFPAGQLYLNVRGMSSHPVEPAEALVRLLRMLEAKGVEQARTEDELAEIYRIALCGRLLTILDDVSDERQVRPLLAGSNSSATLITSRLRLSGLQGAHLIELDTLEPGDALKMLSRILGPERLSVNREAGARILHFAEGLPLAVRIAGARLLARPHLALGKFADRLADEDRRLEELSHNDLEVGGSLASTFSYLGPHSTDAFLLLGSRQEQDFTAASAAAALGVPEKMAEDIIEQLVDVQLVHVVDIEQVEQPRYRLKELVRLFARSQVADLTAQVGADERRQSA